MTSLAVVSSGSDIHPALPKLLTKISGESLLLRQLDRYYTGTQPVNFMSPEVSRATFGRLRSVVLNWCRLVVNSLEERLDVVGFRLATDEPADKELWRIWQANNLDEASQMCHADALVHGRAYVIVWANDDDPKTPRITVESAEQMTVEFEPGTTDVASAVKCWSADDMAYATLYLPDSVWQYEAPVSGVNGSLVSPQAWELRADPIAHDLGVVPVVPMINRPRPTHLYGESELTDIIPLVDVINKLASDMMTTAHFYIEPRRWMTGIDMGDGEGSASRVIEMMRKRYSNAAPGDVWASDSIDTQFGQFPEAQLDGYQKSIEMFAGQIAAIAGLPPHYVGLMSQANPASADAIRSAEASLVQRAERKQRFFGGDWEDVMRLALRVRDGVVPANAQSMETIWRNPETKTWAQQVDAAVKLDAIGVPFRANMEIIGQSPVQVDRMEADRTTDALNLARAQLEAVDEICRTYGVSRAAALSIVGLQEAAKVEAIVEARAPGPGVTNDTELHDEVEAATPDPVPGVGPDGAPQPSKAADKADPVPPA